MYSYSTNTDTSYQDEFNKNFYKMLSKGINEIIIPKFGRNLTFSISTGLFTSGQYGSYRIDFINNDTKTEICYIIADIIMGEWKFFETKKS